MIWVDLGKRFLGCLPTKDFDALDEILSDDFVFIHSVERMSLDKEELLDVLEADYRKATLKIVRQAYRDKLVFFEVEEEIEQISSKFFVFIIEINDNGKIKQAKVYG